jgi:SAM-dependent methyltransferase
MAMDSVSDRIDLGRRIFHKLSSRFHNFRQEHQRVIISKILSRKNRSRYYDSDKIFNSLQKEFPSRPEYKYDPYSTWRRGVERAINLFEFVELCQGQKSILEVTCGDGMAGFILYSYNHYVTLNDIEDWRDYRAKKIPFVQSDICQSLNIDSNSFDLVCSYNGFEHLEDPTGALDEVIRVCKKGGLIYLEFGPLYASPWGMHVYRTVKMPYPQFLFSESFLKNKLDELGIYDLGLKRSDLQPLNKWRLNQFIQLWRNCDCDIVKSSLLTDVSCLELIRRFPEAFYNRDLTYEDVTTQAIIITLKKR